MPGNNHTSVESYERKVSGCQGPISKDFQLPNAHKKPRDNMARNKQCIEADQAVPPEYWSKTVEYMPKRTKRISVYPS